ncbi:MAG: pyridoxal phosphate-dependent aminotransferase [Armatimonadetes bacterium]|nr:pyridoxal phosphate-dependent aminotransferase [Armatimonadota bacterium]
MPAISRRAKAMPASPIRRLVPYAEKALASGKKIYHLNIGQPDVESPVEFWNAVTRSGLKVLEYSHSAGIASLRQKAAESYRAMGIDVATEHVTVCTAGSEALLFAMLATMDIGDEVIVPEPFYANYLGFAGVADVNLVTVPTSIHDGFRLPPVEEFRKRVTSRTKAVLVNNPGNPTGTVYTDDQLEGLRAMALENDLYVIADEVYREFNYTGRPIKSVLQLEGIDDRAIMVDSVSKRFSLCGARIGFLVCRNADVNAGVLKYAQARLSPPTLESYGVLGALDAPQSYFDGVRSEFVKRRDLLVSRLRAIPGVVCPDIDGAFYAMVELPVDDADEFCKWLLESFDLNGETVMFAPGSGFYEDASLGKRQVRIAYVLECAKLDRAMDCLEAALAAYPGRLQPAPLG